VDLATDRLTAPAHETACRIAHTLAGKLGMFGFNEAMRWAREIGQGLHRCDSSAQTQNGSLNQDCLSSIAFLECAVFSLRQEIELATIAPMVKRFTPSAPPQNSRSKSGSSMTIWFGCKPRLERIRVYRMSA
jgi:chemotaxis protein histidine kinase CheA